MREEEKDLSLSDLSEEYENTVADEQNCEKYENPPNSQVVSKETGDCQKSLTKKIKIDSETRKRIRHIMAQLRQSSGIQALQEHTSAWQRKAEWASKYSHIYSSFPKYVEIQAQVGDIISKLTEFQQVPEIHRCTIDAITRAYTAIGNASLSGSLGEYKQNIETAIEAAEDLSNSDSESNITTQENPLIEQLKELHSDAENAEEKDLPKLQNGAAKVKIAFDENINEKVSKIESTLSTFLINFDVNVGKLLDASLLTQQNIGKLVDEAKKNNGKIAELLHVSEKNAEAVAEQLKIAEKNGNTVKALHTVSQNNFDASKIDAKKNKILSYVAIGIAIIGVIVQIGLAIYDYRTDKHREIIKILQKKCYRTPIIHVEKSKDVKIALGKSTVALQENVQFKQKIERLQTDLSKAQGNLAVLQKQYDASIASCLQERQKIHAVIAGLKKQIEELKAELAKRPLPPPVAMQEGQK